MYARTDNATVSAIQVMGPDVRTSGHTYPSCFFCNTLTDPHCIWMDRNYSWVYANRTAVNDTFVKQILHQGFGIHLDDVFGSKARPDQYSPPRNATTNATIELPETMPHNPNSGTAPWIPYLSLNHVSYCNNPGHFIAFK